MPGCSMATSRSGKALMIGNSHGKCFMKSPNSPVALIVSHQAGEKSGESRWFHDRAIEYFVITSVVKHM